MMVEREALVNQFAEISVVNLNEEVLSKCEELCLEHGLDEEALVDTWTAFSAMHLGFVAPTPDTLLRMEREMLKKKPIAKKKPEPKKKVTSAKLVDLALPEGYSTPPKAKNPGILELSNDTSPVLFSPASYSPANATPSRRFVQNAASGKVVSEFGSSSTCSWKSSKEVKEGEIVVEHHPTGDEVLLAPYHYMFEPTHISRAVLCDHIDRLGRELQKKNNIPELSPLNEASSEQVVVCGRVACDAEDAKLTANSMVLVGANEKDEVTVGLHKLPSYALFPGQVVALKALNPSGKHLMAEMIYSDVSPPVPKQSINIPLAQGPLQLVVASGPFTHSDAMTYEPLHAFVQYIKEHKPHVVILIGPFVDAGHQCVQQGLLDVTFEAFFHKLVNDILQPIHGSHTRVVLVPSVRDAHHYTVYPSPPFFLQTNAKKPLPENLILTSDPCLLSVNGVVMGFTAADVLMHLGRCEIASQAGADRLGRLASHVLHQGNFYPLYPPTPQLSVHLESWEKFAQMPIRPHILVLPSDLRHFVKDVDGCVVINPERLAKGVGGGTFARLEIEPPKEGEPFVKSVKAQVVKI